MKWAEPLPESCPPQDARHPNGELLYRIINGDSPTEDDFYSYRRLCPDKPFSLGECIARALSVFDKITACERILKTPRFRGKKIIQLELHEDSGMIMKTGKDPHHFSWWLADGCNPLDITKDISE